MLGLHRTATITTRSRLKTFDLGWVIDSLVRQGLCFAPQRVLLSLWLASSLAYFHAAGAR